MNNETAQHHPSVKVYLLVFAGLALLTGLTVALSYMGLPHKRAIALAGLIALTKVVLIASFFMHLKVEKRGLIAMLLVALFFVAVLVGSLIQDIGLLS